MLSQLLLMDPTKCNLLKAFCWLPFESLVPSAVNTDFLGSCICWWWWIAEKDFPVNFEFQLRIVIMPCRLQVELLLKPGSKFQPGIIEPIITVWISRNSHALYRRNSIVHQSWHWGIQIPDGGDALTNVVQSATHESPKPLHQDMSQACIMQRVGSLSLGVLMKANSIVKAAWWNLTMFFQQNVTSFSNRSLSTIIVLSAKLFNSFWACPFLLLIVWMAGTLAK